MSRRHRKLIPALTVLAAVLFAPAAVAQTPTHITAEGVLLHRQSGLTHVSADGPRAALRTDTGAPVVDREVIFLSGQARTELCRARTDYLGDARCGRVLVGPLLAASERSYYAVFEGDALYAPSWGNGALVQWGTFRL